MNKSINLSKNITGFKTTVRYARLQKATLVPIKNSKAIITPKSKPNKTTVISQVANNLKTSDLSPHLRNNGLDKVNFLLPYQVRIDYLKAKSKSLGLTFDDVRLNSGKHGIEMSAKNGEKVILELYMDGAAGTRKVITNPSHFSSFRAYLKFLKNIFGRNEIESASIYRYDLAVDLPENFATVLKGLMVSRKQAYTSHIAKSGASSGVLFGKGDEVYSIYDKERELKERKKIYIKRPLTRIEVRLTGKKKLITKIGDLPLLTKTFKFERESDSSSSFDFFDKLEFRKPIFIEKDKCKNIAERDRLVDFMAITRELGFAIARKKANKNYHFQRDYGHLFTIEDFGYDLNLLLIQKLKRFFGQKELIQGRGRYEF